MSNVIRIEDIQLASMFSNITGIDINKLLEVDNNDDVCSEA